MSIGSNRFSVGKCGKSLSVLSSALSVRYIRILVSIINRLSFIDRGSVFNLVQNRRDRERGKSTGSEWQHLNPLDMLSPRTVGISLKKIKWYRFRQYARRPMHI